MNTALKKYHTTCIYLVLALCTLAVYWQVNNFEFITSFDDDIYIVDNDHINGGLTWEGIKWAFAHTHAYNWHPLTSISHMADCTLYGLDPAGHHLSNVVLHIINALLLLYVLKRMTGALWPSAFVAAAFALHPLHVESVAWISERKDMLSTLFWILTMLAYVRYAERPTIKRYLVVALSLALGLMAKQMLVTLPFVLLLLDYWPLGRLELKGYRFRNSALTVAPVSVSRCILEKLPLIVLSIAAGLTIYLVQQNVELVKSGAEYPFLYRVGNAMTAYIKYIARMFWPMNLSTFYPHMKDKLPQWQIAGSAMLLVYVTVESFWRAKVRPYLAVGWLWYLGTLVPVIGLVQIGLQAQADRYTYIPLTGLFIIIAWGAPELIARLRYRKAVLSVAAVLLLCALGVTTFYQVGHWQSNITLHRRAAAVVPDNYWAYNNLAWSLATHKQAELRDGRTAVKYAKRACELTNYNNPVVLDTLAASYAASGDFPQAVVTAKRALRLALFAHQKDFAAELGQRIALYKAGELYIQP